MVSVEVAGPGFVNFRLDDGWLHDALAAVLAEGEEGYARPDVGHGEKVQVEFISANPTGPIHVGNGWWGSYGDALARVLDRSGHVVSREYYVNDTGGQIRTLGRSLLARHKGEEVPEGGYQGQYVTELAAAYDGPDDETAAGRWAAERILERIKATLDSVGIVFDEWYSQASIEESGAVDETIALLDAKGLVFEEDGATWFRSTELGDTRDRVLRKANGDATYLAGDLAYHRDKFLVRGFDRVIDVFGADHHGQVASLMAGVEALGVDPSRARGQARPDGLAGRRRRVGQDGQAGGQRHRPRHGDRRHRPRRHPNPQPHEHARPGRHLRPGHGARAVGREPGLLRPDGQRPHRRGRPQGGRAGHHPGPARPRSTCRCSPTPASSRCSAASRSCPRWWPTRPSTGPRPR